MRLTAIAAAVMILLAACGGGSDEEAADPSEDASAQPTSEATEAPTETPSETQTPTATATPTETPTPEPTLTDAEMQAVSRETVLAADECFQLGRSIWLLTGGGTYSIGELDAGTAACEEAMAQIDADQRGILGPTPLNQMAVAVAAVSLELSSINLFLTIGGPTIDCDLLFCDADPPIEVFGEEWLNTGDPPYGEVLFEGTSAYDLILGY